MGFPKFKARKTDENSYTTNRVSNNINLLDKYIILPKLGMVRIKKHREIPQSYILKSCNISQMPTGKYFVSILFEYESSIVSKDIETVVDLRDLENLTNFYYRPLKKLKEAQKKMFKMQKHSKNRNKQRIKVAKIYEKMKNSRRDFLHKQSRQIANSYDLVYAEDLKGGMFYKFLEYKLKEEGKHLY